MNKEQRIEVATAFAEEALAGRVPKDAKLLGKGLFARVYEVAGLAVKVQMQSRRNGFAPSQAGEVLESIFYRQIESPHFPKVHAFIGTSNDTWAAVIEKLHKVENRPRRTTAAVRHAAWSVLPDYWGYRETTRSAWERAPLTKSQKAGIRRAMRELDLAGFEPSDVHGGNIMRRRSRIILTDVVM